MEKDRHGWIKRVPVFLLVLAVFAAAAPARDKDKQKVIDMGDDIKAAAGGYVNPRILAADFLVKESPDLRARAATCPEVW